MKLLSTTILLLLYAAVSYSQNYQCVQPGVKRYFIPLSGSHIRGMRVDSVSVVNSDSIFHLFRSPRGPYISGSMSQLDTNGGSWLGKTIIQKQDGTTLIPTFWADTCVIQTHALLGNTWTFYNDNSPNYYKATVMSVDTMTVLGVLDSVKTIKIKAFNSAGINYSDSVHGKKIILSKEHGIVQTIPLYMFPYHDQFSTSSNGQDYLLDHSPDRNGPIYQLFELKIPNGLDFYNYDIGDVFEYYHYFSLSNMPYGKSLDSITSKTIISPVQVNYTGHRFTENYIVGPPQNHFEYADSLFSFEAHAGPVFTEPVLMPEESGAAVSYYYNPDDSSHCFKSYRYGYVTNIIGPDGIIHDFEPCGTEIQYKGGFWIIDYSECTDPSLTAYTFYLIYSVKKGVACGSYEDVTDVGTLNSVSEAISVFPIPADKTLNIHTKGQLRFNLINLTGTVVRSTNESNKDIVLDVSDLPNGIYFLLARSREDSYSTIRKILIGH